MQPMSRVEEGAPEDQAPEWVASWLPQRHVEIAAEIERLKEEARQIESLGRLLWQTGEPLAESVRDVFLTVGLEAELTPQSTVCDVAVRLEPRKRLLITVIGSENAITNRSPQIKQVFEASQGVSEGDRVVLAANVHRTRPVAEREWLDPATAEAMMIVRGVGAVLVTTATLFKVWSLCKRHPQTAAENFLYLHGAASGLLTYEQGVSHEEGEGAADPEGLTREELEAARRDGVPPGGIANRLVNALRS